MIRIAHSENHVIELPPGHRFPIQKYELVRLQLEREGVIRKGQVFAPEFITDETVEWTHSADFWARAKQNALSDKEIRRIGFPRSEMLVQRSLSSASGTVRAAEHALQDGCGMNLAGGTHHAFFDRGEGFCLLNDIAVAANYLLRTGQISRALVIDLDVHQGNGTASLFAGSKSVFTFSMHCTDNYPFRKENSHRDVEVEAYAGDVTYLALLKQHIPALLESEAPDIVFYQAGVDVLATDRLGKLNLSREACYQRDKWVISRCRERKIPLVVVMGGGYSEQLPTLVNAHCNTFKLAIEFYENQPYFLS